MQEAPAPQLPVLCPQLVMPLNFSRLAIPLGPLSQSTFNVDVLSLTGMPVLAVTLNHRESTSIRVTLHTIGTLIAVVTPGHQILAADGTHIGLLARNGTEQYTLYDKPGRIIMKVVPSEDGTETCMFTECGGRTTECATLHRRSAEHGRLPHEHYELVVNPGIDSVLVLAVFLAMTVPWSSDNRS